jgi:phosphinothricin acetyltransferase
VEVRPARLDDAEAIRAIYNHEVLNSTVTFDLVARTSAEQREWLEARSGAHAVLVAVDGEEVVGFAALSTYRDRPAYTTTVEDSVYVAPTHQGHGVGRMLLAALLDTAARHGFHSVIARVVGGHDASINLHRAMGFSIVGTERQIGRKFGQWLDVVVMQRVFDDDETMG